jgi:hypothetical protein
MQQNGPLLLPLQIQISQLSPSVLAESDTSAVIPNAGLPPIASMGIFSTTTDLPQINIMSAQPVSHPAVQLTSDTPKNVLPISKPLANQKKSIPGCDLAASTTPAATTTPVQTRQCITLLTLPNTRSRAHQLSSEIYQMPNVDPIDSLLTLYNELPGNEPNEHDADPHVYEVEAILRFKYDEQICILRSHKTFFFLPSIII